MTMDLRRLTWVLVSLLVATMCVRVIVYLLGASDAYLYYFTDDFYYYLLPAKNFVAHGISSFDGFTVTNGYHPLWFLSVCAMALVSGGNDRLIFALVVVVSAASSLLTVRSLLRLQVILFSDGWLAPAMVLIVSIVLVAQSFVGMETVLAIPLFCTLLERLAKLDLSLPIARPEAIRIGLLSSLLVLARLDTALLVLLVLLGIGIVGRGSWKQKGRIYLWFALGGVLVPVYFSFNLLHFGYLMPVSAMVKGLKVGHAIRSEAVPFLFTYRDGIGGMFFVPIGLIALWIGKKRFATSAHRLVILVALLYPVLLYVTFFLTSDWYLQRWYLWPMPVCTFLVLGLLSHMWKVGEGARSVLRRASFLLASVLVLFSVYSVIAKDIVKFEPDALSPYIRGKELAAFVREHPGRYAMGDAAGTVAYVINAPVLQLEGLAADYRYYEHIKHEDDLVSVLNEYKIDYLIEFPVGVERTPDGCYKINEPLEAQAGKHSRTMHGLLCSEPVFTIRDSIAGQPEVKEYVFAVGPR